MLEPRPYQLEAEQSIWNYFNSGQTGNPLIAMPTGCHARGTNILLFDGSVRLVEHIAVGDLLMGPDSKPRKVLSLARGREQMCEILPTKGEPFAVNISHILSLQQTTLKSNPRYPSQIGGHIRNIPINRYLTESKYFKHTHKLRRVGVDFSTFNSLSLDPWFLGVLLGNGCLLNGVVNMTTPDDNTATRAMHVVSQMGLTTRIANKPNTAASSYHFSDPLSSRSVENRLTRILRNLHLMESDSEHKFIPIEFKTASREDRLQLLAGLIDTDGSMTCNGFDYISKSPQLAKDIQFICRSVGLAAYIMPCTKHCQNGFTGTYHRVSISGNCCIVPTILRKHCAIRKQKKDVLRTGFDVALLPEDDYFGFELDSDHLYLTEDFIVHHNTGKSLVIGWFIEHAVKQFPGTRILTLTHVKELIKQNSDKLREIWPEAPLGIYSAGLKQKDHHWPIIFGGIGTVVNSLDVLGRFDLLLVDEAHLMSGKDDSMYGEVTNRLREVNPLLKVIGFTATPYRTGQGFLTESGLFNHIVCDFTTMHAFNQLINDGYMCMLVPKRTNTTFDISKVSIQNGDYNKTELEAAVDHRDVNYLACKETLEFGADRNTWLTFASGVNHADHIAEMFCNFGIPARSIHSKMDAAERDRRVADFRNGKYRCAVTNNILTTGFDLPRIDLIAMMRPTVSTGLWVQMLGRGTRPSPETAKQDCLCLDFAGNTPRLGPINDPVIPRKRKGGSAGVAPIRICDNCGTYNHASATHCFMCGMEFPRQVHISATAGTEELVKTDLPMIQQFRVDRALYSKFPSNGFNILKVSYVCGLRDFSEICCLEHPGRARGMAIQWWKKRMGSDVAPPNVDEALKWTAGLAVPKSIYVDVNMRYPKVIKAEF